MCMKIGSRAVGASAPLFVIAEIGLNHGGSLHDALALVDAAARAGASAVKLPTLRGDTLMAQVCPPLGQVNCGSLRDFFRTFELDRHATAAVAERARSRGLAFMSTPSDEEAIDVLEEIGCDAYKIASGDITHLRLIAGAARTGKPLVLSTGMSELSEISRAVACARDAGAGQIAVLHCVSAYPVPHGSHNLRAIPTIARELGVPVGLSDHGTDGLDIVLAVALGACVYERHIVLDGKTLAVDAAVAATGRQLAILIQSAERARRALGDGRKTCLAAEAPNKVLSRRALYATRDLRPGEVITASDVVALRPAEGVGADRWASLIGRQITRTISAGEPFLDTDVAAVSTEGDLDARLTC